MSAVNVLAILELINVIRKVGETLVDGDRADDFKDILEALSGFFTEPDSDKDKEEGKE